MLLLPPLSPNTFIPYVASLVEKSQTTIDHYLSNLEPPQIATPYDLGSTAYDCLAIAPHALTPTT